MSIVAARRLALLESVTRAFGDEIPSRAPEEPVAWSRWPDVAALVGHLGGVHRWATTVVRTGERVPQPADRPAPTPVLPWYLAGRDALLDAVRASLPDDPCWVITGADRSTGFWWRRMVFETTKHLIDLRAAGGGSWRVAEELEPDDYADGVDELVSVFLQRSRPGLAPLPGPVRLVATDADRSWTFAPDWDLVDEPMSGAVEIRARAGDLALVVWQRADPTSDAESDAERFAVSGPERSVAAFLAAPIHP